MKTEIYGNTLISNALIFSDKKTLSTLVPTGIKALNTDKLNKLKLDTQALTLRNYYFFALLLLAKPRGTQTY